MSMINPDKFNYKYKPSSPDRSLLISTGVPPKTADKALEIYKRDSPPALPSFEGKDIMFLHGDTGSGKTVTSAMLILDFIFNKKVKADKIKFTTVSDLLFEFKANYSDPHSMSERELFREYSMAKLMVLDDLGTQKITDWNLEIIQMIIYHRYESYRPTIVTSNYDLSTLTEVMQNERITSRLNDSVTISLLNTK